MRSRRSDRNPSPNPASPLRLRGAGLALTLFGAAALLPVERAVAAQPETAEALARVEAELGQPIERAPVDQVADAVARTVADLPPAELRQAIDLVGGITPLMPNRAAAETVAQAARRAVAEVAEANPEVIEDWWARIIAESITMIAVDGHGAAPAEQEPSVDRPAPRGLSFARARARVEARLGQPIEDADPAELGRAVGAAVAALPPESLQQAITIAGAVVADVTDPRAARAVADAATAAVADAAARNPASVPDWRRQGIIESIALFAGGFGDPDAPGVMEAGSDPVYTITAGDLAIVPEPVLDRRAPNRPETAVAPALDMPPAVEAAALPAAAMDEAGSESLPAVPVETAALPPDEPLPPLPPAVPDRGFPSVGEVRALLREQGMEMTAQNLNRAMAMLLSGRRDIGSAADLASIEPAAGTGLPSRSSGRASYWWHDRGRDALSASAGDRPSSGRGGAGGADPDPGGAGGSVGTGGSGGDSGGSGSVGGDDEDDDDRSGSGGGSGNRGSGGRDDGGRDGNRGGSDRDGDDDDDDGGDDDDGDRGGRGGRGGGDDRGRDDDRDRDRDRDRERGRDRDDRGGGLGERVRDAVSDALDD